MMRVPLIPTLLVAAAVLTMVGLGVWQLSRAGEKAQALARFEQNRTLPPIALPAFGAVDESLLYRRVTAFCLEVTGWRRLGGKSASGRTGTRFIADCRTGAEGPGFAADMGVSPDPKAQPRWKGGEVSGLVAAEPGLEGLFARLTGNVAPPRPMIVSDRAAPGLEISQPPSPPQSNSSWSYAFQWFFFAAVAALIYLLALRRRQRGTLPPGA